MNEKNMKLKLAKSQKMNRELQEELKKTNSELLQLTLELDERVADRTKALQKSQEELRKHRDHLQELVEERTVKLEKLNKKLKKKLHELKTSEERFRSLVVTIPDIIYRINTTGEFVFLNDPVQRLNYKPEELIGKHFSDIIYPPDVERVSRSKVLPKYKGKITSNKKAPKLFDERRTGNRKTPGLEIRLLNNDGMQLKNGLIEPIGKKMIAVEVSSSGIYEINPRSKKNMFIGTVGVIRDITERKRAEKALREAHRQLVHNERLAVLGQLAGGVGHELRNPLGAIKSAAYFLNMVLEKPEPDVKETLGFLEKEVATSERIISSLIDFACPKPPTKRKVDVNNIIQSVLANNAMPENVKVVSRLDESLPAIQADPDQLAQVFANIIFNAIQAMPEGGELVISSEIPSPKWVVFSFKDTGGGIAKENLKKLFAPLFTTKAKGIGLGLAVTRTLVEGHGGTIAVESKEGKGSTFSLMLPVSEKGR